MELCKKRVLLCIVLVFLGLVLSAGCVGDRAPPPRSDTDDENPEARYIEEEEENETGYEESYNSMGDGGFLDKAEGYYDEESARDAYCNQYVDYGTDETGGADEEEDYDYAIDSGEATPDGNPVDAIKDLDDYDTQDNGSTIILDTDTGEIAY